MLTTDSGAELDSCDSLFINILQEGVFQNDYININLTQSYYKLNQKWQICFVLHFVRTAHHLLQVWQFCL